MTMMSKTTSVAIAVAKTNKEKWIISKLFKILVEYNFIKCGGEREHESYKSSQNAPAPRCGCVYVWACGRSATDGCALCNIGMPAPQICTEFLRLICPQPPANLCTINAKKRLHSIYSPRMAQNVSGNDYQDLARKKKTFILCTLFYCWFCMPTRGTSSQHTLFSPKHRCVQIYALIRN